MSYRGQTTIAFLFTRVRLGWDVQLHSYYTATGVILRIIGLCTVSLLGPVLGNRLTAIIFIVVKIVH